MRLFSASNQSSTQVTFVRVGGEAANDASSVAVPPAAAAGMSAQIEDEFVSQDVATLDVSTPVVVAPSAAAAAPAAVVAAAVVEADPGLESLILGDPSVAAVGAAAAVVAGQEAAATVAEEMMMLDPEQIDSLENVLRSAGAKEMLGAEGDEAADLGALLGGVQQLPEVGGAAKEVDSDSSKV